MPFLIFLLATVSAAAHPTAPGPYHLASGDLNRDGHPDLVVVCRGELLLPTEKRPGNDTVSVYFTEGTPEPTRRQDFTVGFGPYTALVHDLDGDGFQDLAVVNFQANDNRHVSILWGQDQLPFLAPDKPLAIPGNHVYDKQRTPSGEPIYSTPGLTSIATVDANRDGKPDLVAVAWSSDFFVILQNSGRRQFRLKLYALPPGPRDVAVADFNRDGFSDLAFTIYSSNLVEVWLGEEDGAFRRHQQFHAQGHIPYHLKAADLDRDGFADLVVGNRGPSDNVSVFLNQRGELLFNGSYRTGSPKKGEMTADEIRDVLLQDEDGDGILDLLAAGHVSHKVITWRGTGRTGYGEAFESPQFTLFPGQGPRTLLPFSRRIAVGMYDSNEWLWWPGTRR